MGTAFDRTKLLINEETFKIVQDATVMVVGCGGVGAMCVEALARFGVTKLIIVDHDTVSVSNINRQVHATHQTIAQKKVEALKDRVLAIQPMCNVRTIDVFINNESIDLLKEYQVDVLVDAIDTVTNKLLLIRYAQENSLKIVSSMGMGNRIDPTKVTSMPLKKTTYDPLAKVMRYQCRKQGLDDTIMVVCSLEQPIKQNVKINDSNILKESMPPASSSFVPMAAGLACAYQSIKMIIEKESL